MDPINVEDENKDLKIEDGAEEDGTFDEAEIEPISEEEWAKILSSDFDAEAFDAFSLADENSELYEDYDFEDDEDGADDEERE